MSTSIYDPIDYFTSHPDSPEQMAWEYGMLRYGDQLPAIAYALGIESFEECRNILGFKEQGQMLYPISNAKKQLELLLEHQKRTPKGILEIGGGRGEISIAFENIGIMTKMIEPSFSVRGLLRQTCKKFEMEWMPLLINYSLGESLDIISRLSETDTVIVCETIEHIDKDEFDNAFTKSIKPLLQRTHGLLIITNWLHFHPIPIDPPWHIRQIDDKLYDWLAQDGKTIYRNGSHLVIKFGNK